MPPPPGGGQAANSAATVNTDTSFRYNRKLHANFVGGEGTSRLGMVHIKVRTAGVAEERTDTNPP